MHCIWFRYFLFIVFAPVFVPLLSVSMFQVSGSVFIVFPALHTPSCTSHTLLSELLYSILLNVSQAGLFCTWSIRFLWNQDALFTVSLQLVFCMSVQLFFFFYSLFSRKRHMYAVYACIHPSVMSKRHGLAWLRIRYKQIMPTGASVVILCILRGVVVFHKAQFGCFTDWIIGNITTWYFPACYCVPVAVLKLICGTEKPILRPWQHLIWL